VIAHVVLFKPRPGLSQADATLALEALRQAADSIPSIRRVRVGRRIKNGRQYEQQMAVDYSVAAIFEFDDLEGLLVYLNHTKHETLARTFFDLFDEALVYDFDLADADVGVSHFGNLLR
jgi:hypothetical protein